MLAVAVLGPVTALREGVALELRGARQRTLLAALVLDAGQVVPSEVLVQRVWGDDLPAGPENALQQQVLKLRRALGKDHLTFEPPGYRLAVAEDAIDSVRFERLLESARVRVPDDPESAGALLDEALSMWRGGAFADVAYEDWASGEVARLEELRLQAEELRAQTLLTLGRPGEAVASLERLIHADPLRERLRAMLMLALYRDGRQGDALTAYTTGRTRLVESLGVEPGAELRTLHDRILRQDPTLGHAAGGEAGRLAPPLPSALRRHATVATFVGREAELARLASAWTDASGGALTCVLIAGEPGAGKTRLAAEHALAAASMGATVAYARGDEDDAAPFGLFVTVLAQLAEVAPADVLEAHAQEHGGELGRLVPSLRARIPALPAPRSADPDTERFRLREAAVAFIRAVAARAPSLLVLDDIHWADRSTLSLLLHLLRGPDAPLLVVATCREVPGDVRPPLRMLLPDLLREPETTRLALDGLSEPDVIELVQRTLASDGDAAAALGREVHRETNGNALFATELVRHLAASGGLTRGLALEAAGTGDLGVPAAIRDLVVQRLERIGPEAADTLVPATVIGLVFDAGLVARATGRQQADVLESLARARELALVFETGDEPGRFSFSHAVIHAALAQSLGSGQRQLLHRRIADELTALGATDAGALGEIARHRLESCDDELGREAAVLAGDAALELLAPDEAARWYRRALDVVPDDRPRERCDLLVRLGEAERRAGSDAFHAHLLEAGRIALELRDPNLAARAALADNRGMHSRTGFVDDQRLELLNLTLELQGDADTGRRALLLATASSELWSGDHDLRRSLSDEALKVARRAGDERALAETIYRRAFAISEPATLAERLDLTAELVDLADRLGEPLLGVLASVERSRAAIEAGDLAEALIHVERQRVLATDCGDAYGRHGAGWAQAWPHALAGRYAEAERAAEEALAESLSSEQPDALAFYGAQLCVIRWDQGRLGELADVVLAQSEGPDGLPIHRALAALALAEGDRLAEARAVVDAGAVDGFALPVDTIWLAGTVIWGEACVLCGRAEHADRLLELLLPWKHQVAFTGLAVHGAAAHTAAQLAALAGRDEAGDLFALAESIHERLGAPAMLARTRVGWSRWLAARGEGGRARTVMAEALEAADACGQRHLLQPPAPTWAR